MNDEQVKRIRDQLQEVRGQIVEIRELVYELLRSAGAMGDRVLVIQTLADEIMGQHLPTNEARRLDEQVTDAVVGPDVTTIHFDIPAVPAVPDEVLCSCLKCRAADASSRDSLRS